MSKKLGATNKTNEQRAKSNKQRAKSNEQQAKSNEQGAKSNEQRAKSNEQLAKRFTSFGIVYPTNKEVESLHNFANLNKTRPNREFVLMLCLLYLLFSL